MGRRLLVLLLSLVLVAQLDTIGRADAGGAWLWFEYRQPILGLPPRLPRLSLRLFSDTRLHSAAGGLAQQFLRVGPILDAAPWLFLAVHGTIYADRRPDGSFDQEARLEVEPNFYGSVGRFSWNDRNRLEYRWRESGARVRYRNQLRLSYGPLVRRLVPYVWDEVLFDAREGFNENRVSLGLGFMLSSNVRLDVGYLLRSRVVSDAWQHDHLLLVYMFVGPPPAPKRR
jgi:hypothetical protein